MFCRCSLFVDINLEMYFGGDISGILREPSASRIYNVVVQELLMVYIVNLVKSIAISMQVILKLP